jgi:hypothetical protein
LPPPPASAPELPPPRRSEALEAELAMLEAVLPDEPAPLQPEPDGEASQIPDEPLEREL